MTGTIVETEDTDIGLILRVTPRVGQDGLIVMNIDAQRSQVDFATGQAIATDANGQPIISPAIDITQAQSTVTAIDGQTVVFGGLITKERTQFSRRVPYISNIPLLGQLFRYDQEIEQRSELLIVLTPRIVDDEDDIRMINDAESSRMSYCLADVVEMHGHAGLSGGYGLWGPAVGAMIYPDMQPTIDHIPAPQGFVEPGEQIVPGSMQPEISYPQDVPVEAIPYHSSEQTPSAPGMIEPAAPIQSLPPMIGQHRPTGQPVGSQPVAGAAPQRIPVEVFNLPSGPGIPGQTMPVGYNAPAPRQ